jgi:hypothetical protein
MTKRFINPNEHLIRKIKTMVCFGERLLLKRLSETRQEGGTGALFSRR